MVVKLQKSLIFLSNWSTSGMYTYNDWKQKMYIPPIKYPNSFSDQLKSTSTTQFKPISINMMFQSKTTFCTNPLLHPTAHCDISHIYAKSKPLLSWDGDLSRVLSGTHLFSAVHSHASVLHLLVSDDCAFLAEKH